MTEFPPLVASPYFYFVQRWTPLCAFIFGILCMLRLSFAKATFDVGVGEFEATDGLDYDPLDESDFFITR